MKKPPLACVILCAGQGTRMKSALPKVLHEVAGLPMIGHVIHAASELNAEELVVVTGPSMPQVGQVAQSINLDVKIAIQHEALGTGHAVRAAEAALEGFEGLVFVLYGDTPLISAQTLHEMTLTGATVTVLGMRPKDPAAYGRLMVDDQNHLIRIVEYNDANAQERAIDLCNSGVMAVQAQDLFRYLREIKNQNAKNEYYLTDIVELACKKGKHCAVVEAAEETLLGVNSRQDLARAEVAYQQSRRAQLMDSGVTMLAPDTVMLHHDTYIEADVIIEPNVIFGEGVEVFSGATIRAFSYLEGASVGCGAIVGPYARLRPGTHLGADVRVGNFVEIKNAELGEGAKVNHLSYVGDATIGAFANIGAGTITCNYDGFQKSRTIIGDHAFIGSNSALVAPVEIGEGAIIGAGSTITEDVESDALSMTRPQQLHRIGWAQQFRTKRQN